MHAMLQTRLGLRARGLLSASQYVCPSCRRSCVRFSTNRTSRVNDQGPFRTRLRTALRDTKVEWKPIPIALGITFLGAVQFYRVQERERRKLQDEQEAQDKLDDEAERKGKPRKRKRIRYKLNLSEFSKRPNSYIGLAVHGKFR